MVTSLHEGESELLLGLGRAGDGEVHRAELLCGRRGCRREERREGEESETSRVHAGTFLGFDAD
jgi:hypothetical protein